jgi:hypothetical protein
VLDSAEIDLAHRVVADAGAASSRAADDRVPVFRRLVLPLDVAGVDDLDIRVFFYVVS